MRVSSVHLRDFRTYARAEAQIGPGLTVVHGPNGAGKSNLLEALYFGCTGHSQRTRNERELVRFGAQAGRVVVRLCDRGRDHELAVGFEPGAAKRMTVDGAPVERMTAVDQRPLVSVFSPDRLDLIKGAPSLRRAHLDQLVAALWPARAATRREYSRALAQRNALIAAIRMSRASRETIAGWDAELARHALALREDRTGLVAYLEQPFAQRAGQLGLSGECLLRYRPRSQAEDEQAFVEELRERLPRDLQRGFSTHGPHRDELSFLRDGRELRTYGSQGEQRLALLALLLAERELLASVRDRMPLMLLDDVMSELDGSRRELLAGELRSDGQSLIATTDLAHVPGAAAADVTRLLVSSGVVVQEALAA
ncbi:MAG TPA: DNA replication and repair protein RecF [Solirubrobacteraceae bacterium]|nr:DNA replication and repair protein RecF [Solirubrobacteraceae bacterium]